MLACLHRSDRERITLSSRVKALQKQLSEVQEKAEEAGGSGSHSVIELERVVNAMRKVIDKLQGENEKLKKKRTEAGPLSSTSKSSDKLLEENKKLKVRIFASFYGLLLMFLINVGGASRATEKHSCYKFGVYLCISLQTSSL